MAGGQYLKLAAANVSQAAQEMQQDIADLRQQYTNRERETRRQIDNIRRKINNNNMLMASPASNDFVRADKFRENNKLLAQIVDIEHDLAGFKEQINGRISGVERQMLGLNKEAGHLRGLAGAY